MITRENLQQRAAELRRRVEEIDAHLKSLDPKSDEARGVMLARRELLTDLAHDVRRFRLQPSSTAITPIEETSP